MQQLIKFIDYDNHEIYLEKAKNGNRPWGHEYILMNDILYRQNSGVIIDALVKIRTVRLSG